MESGTTRRAWLSQGRLVLEDGRVVLCDTCPCDAPPPCAACGEAGPRQIDATIPPLSNGFWGCTECAGLAGTYRLTAVADANGDPFAPGVAYLDCFWELRFAEGELPCDVRRIRVKAAERGETELEVLDGSFNTLLFAVAYSGRPTQCDMAAFALTDVSGQCSAGGAPVLLTAVPGT